MAVGGLSCTAMRGSFVQRLVTFAALGVVVGSAPGCGPGLAVRGHGVEPIGRAGANAEERADADEHEHEHEHEGEGGKLTSSAAPT